MIKEKDSVGPFLAVQGLRLHTSNAEGMGSNPGQGTKIPHAIQHSLKKKKKIKKIIMWKKRGRRLGMK